MQIKLTQTAIEKYKPEIVVNIPKDSCDIFEYHRAEELIEYGSEQMRKRLGL